MEKVAIFLGSASDKEKVLPAIKTLKDFDVGFDAFCFSAHRAPHKLTTQVNYVNSVDDFKVIIAAAGMSAGLPGAIAGQTIKPVIGLPLSGGASVNELAALFAIAQMPPGVPVATVAVDGARNAAFLALRIIALMNASVWQNLTDYAKNLEESATKTSVETANWLHNNT